MDRSLTSLPTFGVHDPAIAYTPRRAAYAVIRRGNTFTAVRGPSAYFLPGGGCEKAESFEVAIEREIREELGREAMNLRFLGRAVQYFYARSDNVHFKMEAAFFTAELGSRGTTEPEHELEWLPVSDSGSLLFHSCHSWAVQRAFGGEAHAI